jgi:hypothetical protein
LRLTQHHDDPLHPKAQATLNSLLRLRQSMGKTSSEAGHVLTRDLPSKLRCRCQCAVSHGVRVTVVFHSVAIGPSSTEAARALGRSAHRSPEFDADRPWTAWAQFQAQPFTDGALFMPVTQRVLRLQVPLAVAIVMADTGSVTSQYLTVRRCAEAQACHVHTTRPQRAVSAVQRPAAACAGGHWHVHTYRRVSTRQWPHTGPQ